MWFKKLANIASLYAYYATQKKLRSVINRHIKKEIKIQHLAPKEIVVGGPVDVS